MMQPRLANAIRATIFPLFIGITFLVFSFFYYSLGLPDPAELQAMLASFFEDYGLVAVFLAAFVEAFFVLSFYLPGSLVIVLAVLASDGSIAELSTLALAVGLGALAGILSDYFVGRWGLHVLFARFGGTQSLKRAEAWQARWGGWSMLLLGFHPNFLSLVSTHAGISRVPFAKVAVLSMLSLLIWTPIAVFLISLLVDQVSATSDGQHWYVFGAFLFWAFVAFCLVYFREAEEIQSR
jgi:membrane protein DedA with SNARE-associated domain